MTGDRHFREGGPADLRATFELAVRSLVDALVRSGVTPPRGMGEEGHVTEDWSRQRGLIEFIAAQDHTKFWVCERNDELIGYVRVARFGRMDELTDLAVSPEHARMGVARGLLERCWPDPPSPELGRVVVTIGTPVDLTVYTRVGVMPATGHWHLRHRAEAYEERRALETVDAAEPAVHVLSPDRAVQEWKRLEPLAIGHDRPLLHEFFGRTRSCLACMDTEGRQAAALCWVSPEGEIGPGVGRTPEDLIPVVLAALDRVAKAQEPEVLALYCTTDAWYLLDRLRRLGFHVYWPSWVMSSVPLPGLDRYLPTRPPRLL